MMTLSNLLTFSRAPLAFFFLQENPLLRCFAILGAMITDSMDGYLARRNRSSTTFGAIFDPMMDKFFVYFALTIFLCEGSLSSWELVAMCARDVSLFLYGLIRWTGGTWKTLSVQAIFWGKIFTAIQFLLLMGLSLGWMIPFYVYVLLFGMAGLAFGELWRRGNCSEIYTGSESWK